MIIGNVFRQVQGWLKIKGGTDGTFIGNDDDRLKTQAEVGHEEDKGGKYLDGFHRPISVVPRVMFDYSFRYFTNTTLFHTKTTGSGSSTVDTNLASNVLSTTTANGDEVILQTYRYIHYIPGQSNRVLIQARFNTDSSNTRRRAGQFDSLDGNYFEHDGTNFKVVRRTSTSGSAVDNPTNQSSWNIDKLDGTGYSGKTLDLDKINIFVIDYTWLGAGKIRYGVDFGDKLVWCHQEIVSNVLTTPWSQSGSLPMRFEITNTGTTSGTQNFYITCMSVATFGDSIDAGYAIPFDTSTNEITIGGSLSYIMGVRMRSSRNRASAKPDSFRLITTAGTKALYWQIKLGATLTGASFGNAGNILEADQSATALSGGTVVASGYVETTGSTRVSNELLKSPEIYLGRDIDGNSNAMTFEAQTLGGTSKILLEGLFKELI